MDAPFVGWARRVATGQLPARGTGRPLLPVVLFLAFTVEWLALAVAPLFPRDWLLENVLVFLGMPVLVVGYFRAPLSNRSYLAIFSFLCLHEIGAHYTYAEVPYDAWWAALAGTSLNESLGWTRNHFDRLVHFLYGLLLVVPLRELIRRRTGQLDRYSAALSLMAIMSLSMAYELLEWAAALVFGGELGMAYLGTQGDVWDAHKDMALATAGAVLALTAGSLIRGLRRRCAGRPDP